MTENKSEQNASEVKNEPWTLTVPKSGIYQVGGRIVELVQGTSYTAHELLTMKEAGNRAQRRQWIKRNKRK